MCGTVRGVHWVRRGAAPTRRSRRNGAPRRSWKPGTRYCAGGAVVTRITITQPSRCRPSLRRNTAACRPGRRPGSSRRRSAAASRSARSRGLRAATSNLSGKRPRGHKIACEPQAIQKPRQVACGLTQAGEDVDVLIAEARREKHVPPRVQPPVSFHHRKQSVNTDPESTQAAADCVCTHRPYPAPPPAASEPVLLYSTQPSGKMRAPSIQTPSRRKSSPNRAQSRAVA